MPGRFILEEMNERLFTYTPNKAEMERPSSKLRCDDLVLVVDEKTPRGRWPMGLIEEVFPDSHGHVRSVKVKTATSVYRRDIRKLCLLEGVQN